MTTEDFISQAKLAEIAERYDDMVEFMSKYFHEDGEVTDEARNLFSVAFKNKIGTRRAAWRSLSAEKQNAAQDSIKRLDDYKNKIEGELSDIHQQVIKLIDDKLLEKATTSETKVFFQKMKGDYCRYKAEFTTGEEKTIASVESGKAYEEAMEIATSSLASTDATRLGLALNYSVFHYEIMNDSKKACEVAKQAFDDAIANLDDISDDKRYKDTTLIMQLLRDNLTLWTSDIEKQDPEDESRPEN